MTCAVALMVALGTTAAAAVEIGTNDPDLKIRWDNTLKYSAAARVREPSSKLTANPNVDDGDRNFDRGLISNRVDLLSEFDLSYRRFGFRVSGAGWYDDVYNRSNDNDSPGTVNHTSRPSDEFAGDTRDLHGRNAELLDAFTFGKVDVGEGNVSYRLGQHSVLWGESLFYGMNGIAGGMAPMDVVKILSVPNSQFKEIVRPVPQLSGLAQVSPTVAVGAFYQFGWEKDRLPASGSYFSFVDPLGDGAESIVGAGFARIEDMEAKDSGQGGLQLRMRSDAVDTDFGLYALNWHSKGPQMYILPVSGKYQWVYPENIQTYGASASTTVGNVNLAGEVSTRRNMPLASDGAVILPGTAADNDDNARYAVGNTVHAQLSWLASLGPSFISKEANFLGEIAWHRLLDVTRNHDVLDPNGTKNASAIRVIYEPAYRQVLPGLDLTVPLGMSYTLGKSAVFGPGWGPNRGGDMSIGVTATHDQVWKGSLTFTHYYGESDQFFDAGGFYSYRQDLKDRDFISLSVMRTF